MNFIQPIQIIGTQRSGSNMFRLMLNQLDEISAPHPPHILQRFMPLLPLYGDLNNASNFTRLVDDVCTLVELNPVPWNGLNLDREKISGLCKTHSLIEIFRIIYELKAQHDKASFWMCKSMANVNYAEQMEASGMRPLYIYLYRDGRDVACSFKKAIVGEKHVYHIANQWAKNQTACIKLSKKISPDRFIQVSYENLLFDPEHEMRRISDFLKIAYQPEMFDFYKSEESHNTAVAGKMWANVSQPILKNNSKKYKAELSEMELAIFEKQAGAVLKELGYSLEENGLLNGKPFTESQLQEFEQQNQELKAEAIQSADPEGMKLREGQDMLFSEIKAR